MERTQNWIKLGGKVSANDLRWRHALATCTRAVQLVTNTNQARKTFVAAARNAGLKVLPDDEQK
ncbi:DUF982 domain-containing protein [Rhizobium ruizarguesonis]|nr:DUF982 domain-containing protein [Rhizobium ruizarguesonis]TAX17363.1 DUF982 domain-containing protein [Rhizobium ruizarguesonis]TAX22190.1 DUF982 domain-containing protein [Rhizobium ruizarguesonis]